MRRGASILEVLFAIMVVSIGLLGSVAVFAVGGATLQKSVATDNAGYIARNATASFDTRGMRKPATWYEWNGAAFQPVTLQPLQAYCIDSRFVVANVGDLANARTFPYTHADNPPGPRMHRVAFLGESPAPTVAGARLFSDSVFWISDDLIFERSTDDRSLPATQRWSEQGGLPTRRATHGMYSWMATLVQESKGYDAADPPNPADSVAVRHWRAGLHATPYVLSVVVFHQRPAGLEIDGHSERAVAIEVLDGTGGGPARLTASDPERLKVSRGDWIMLGGILRLTDPVPVDVPRFSWYRVSDAEEPQPAAGGYECFVSLIGSDWDVSLLQQQATIVQGVFAVHEKSVRLEL